MKQIDLEFFRQNGFINLGKVFTDSEVKLFQHLFDEDRRQYPYFWHPIKGIFLSSTIFMVVAVSAERFRAICHSMSKRHVSIL